MRKLALLTALVPLLAACGESPTTAPAGVPQHAVIQNDKVDMTGMVLFAGGCGIADPLVVEKGWAQTKSQNTVDGSGGTHVKVTVSFHGVRTTDALGNHYQVQAITQQTGNLNGNNPQENTTLTGVVRVIGAGQVIDGRLNQLVHTTTNANGDVTVTFVKGELVCH